MHATRDLAIDLHGLLRELDPMHFREEAGARLRAGFERVRARLQEMRHEREEMRERLAALDALLDDVPGDDGRDRWMGFRERAQPVYEALAAALRAEAIDVPALRPTNYKRNLFHVASASGCIAIGELLTEHMFAIAACAAGTAWTLETTRRIWPRWNDVLMSKRWNLVAHPHERHRVNSATWYMTALVVLSLLHPVAIGVAAMAVLGVGDPLAALVGKRWGRTGIAHGRTLEGSLAFVVGGGLAVVGVLAALHPEISAASVWLMAGGAAVAGALAEAFSRRVDDNLSVPLAAAAALVLMRWAGVVAF